MSENIHEMKLHEELDFPSFSILRVPGGWVYTYKELSQIIQIDGTWSGNYLPSSVFVPYRKEFNV